MSDRDEQDLTPEQSRARDAVRSLPRVEPDPAFRERLKADFVAGRLGEAEAPGHGDRPGAGRARRRVRAWRTLVPAAIALAVVVVAILNGGPQPELADIGGQGTVTVDGRNFATSDRSAIAQAVGPGSRVSVSNGVTLDLVYGSIMAVQLSSGTATVPAAPARWFGKTGESRVEMGELSVITGPRFRGGRLVVTTGEGIIAITGTLASVFRDSSVTCVCVHEGTASVGVDAGDMEDIPAGQRKVMFADGSPPIVTDIAPPHRDHMIEFEKKYGAKIRARR
jgi:ferric-dicitrate binding protein FerR (iron transport regulator)